MSRRVRPQPRSTGRAPGWKALREEDFVNVNCDPRTWSWQDGVLRGTGKPVGVIRTRNAFTNFEFVTQWRVHGSTGGSGIVVWTTEEALTGLKPGNLMRGVIEVSILDHGFTEWYEKKNGKKADWFTTHGDVFPVGFFHKKPFPPVSPDGTRSFPSKHLSKGVNEWNHYYVRCINGEVRLWVNGEQVSGGSGCQPTSGYLCLESEGSSPDACSTTAASSIGRNNSLGKSGSPRSSGVERANARMRMRRSPVANLGPCDDFESGMNNGKPSALVLGGEWNEPYASQLRGILASFVQPEVLETRVRARTPPLFLRSPHEFHDRVPDRRRQAVPACDQLAECLVLPAMFRPAHGALSVTASA